MDERGIGALEAAAEADRAQFFGAGIAPERPRDAGAEPDPMRLACGSTGRTGAPSHLAPVHRGALGGGWATSLRRGRILSGTAPCRTPRGERVAARFDARPFRELREEVARKSFPGDNGGSSPGNEGELSPTGIGCRRPSPHRRVSRLRGRSLNCDLGVACKVSRLARGGSLILRAAGRRCKRQSATYRVPRLHTADRVREARRAVSERRGCVGAPGGARWAGDRLRRSRPQLSPGPASDRAASRGCQTLMPPASRAALIALLKPGEDRESSG
jgi:hypothetical protein